MPEYEQSITVHASPDAVLNFVTDVRNLPKYLPTVHHAEPQAPERVRLQGEAHGHSYDADGNLRVDRNARRMEWGSDGENQYRGWLTVTDAGRSQSEVTVHLSFTPPPHMNQEFTQVAGSPDNAITEGLQKALESIRNTVEGHGGKVPLAQEQR